MIKIYAWKTCIIGKVKAMVVTPSRLHAVRYLQEFGRQILEKGYDLDVLVAFSGEIENDEKTYTEEKLNKIKDGKTVKEKALPKVFNTDDFASKIFFHDLKIIFLNKCAEFP